MTLARRSLLRAAGVAGVGAAIGGSGFSAFGQTLPRVRIGAAPVEPQAQVFYALDNGFFPKNGLDAELVSMRSGGVTVEAVLAGQVDVGIANCITFGSALLKGLPLIAVAPGLLNDSRDRNIAIVVAPDSPVRVASDLDGKTVGVTSLGSLDTLAYLAWLGKDGGDPRSLKVIEVTQPAMTETLLQGRIAAGVLYDPELSNVVAAGRVRIVPGAYESIGDLYQATVWFTTTAYLAAQKDVVRRCARALVAGGAWAEANRAASLVILEKYTKVQEAKSVSHYGRRLDPTLIQLVWDAAATYGMYPSPLRAVDHCWNGR